MPQARDYVQDAFTEIKVYQPGDQLLDPDAAFGLIKLNRMLDSWSTEALTVFASLEQSGSLVANQSAYTIGPGGNFNITRPDRLKYGPGVAFFLDTNSNRYPIDVVPRDQWNLIPNIVLVNSNIPTTIFYDDQFPIGTINVYPTPNAPGTIYFDSDLALTQVATLQTAVSFPPGYEKAIIENLAIDLSSAYPSAVVTPQLVQSAAKAKMNIKRLNYKQNVALYDAAIVAQPKKSWDWRKGQY